MSNSPSTSITRLLSEFSTSLQYESLAPEVVAAAKHGVLDFLGVALIGSHQEPTNILRATVCGVEKRGVATVFGTPVKTTATSAALVNGYAAHALDYDDVQPVSGAHFSGAALAASLAIAEQLHLSGKALIAAYVAGFEIGNRLGAMSLFGHHLRDHGAHPTGVLCHFSAVAAASKLLQLDDVQTRRAIGIAAGHAAGLMRSFGTMCKGQNAGNAAHNALLAAQLAKNGFTGPEDIFDGEQNLFAVYGAEGDEAALAKDLGKSFAIPHNTFKISACAGWRNPIIEATAAISKAHKLKASEVTAIDLKICRQVSGLPNYALPDSGLQAKFSAQYAAAVGLVDHCGYVAQFSDERVADPVLRDVARKVTMAADDTFELNQVRATVHTNNGRSFEHFVAIPKGDPRNPLGWDELFGKFRTNALSVMSKRRMNELAGAIRNLENVDDLAVLARMCRGKAKSSKTLPTA